MTNKKEEMNGILRVSLILSLMISLSFYGAFSGERVSASPTQLQHFIFIVQENHSFDNYFGTYCNVQTGQCANGINSPGCCQSQLMMGSGGSMGFLSVKPFPLGTNTNISIAGDELPPGVDDPEDMPNGTSIDAVGDIRITGLPEGFNFSISATPLLVTPNQAPFAFNTESIRCCSHSWNTAHSAWDNGKMDNFVLAEGSVNTMGYYDRQEIPYYWDYADNYVLDDNFFSSLMGPSFPNHLYIAAGQSGGQVDNVAHDWNNGTTNGCNPAGTPACSLNFANMAQMLTQAGVTWHW